MGLTRYNALPANTDISKVPWVDGQLSNVPSGELDNDGNQKVYCYYDYLSSEGEQKRALVANSSGGGASGEKTVNWVDPMVNATRDKVLGKMGRNESVAFFKDVQFTASEAPDQDAATHWVLLVTKVSNTDVKINAFSNSWQYHTGYKNGSWAPWSTETPVTRKRSGLTLAEMQGDVMEAPHRITTLEVDFVEDDSPDGSADTKWFVETIYNTASVLVTAINGIYEYNNIYNKSAETWSGWIRTDGGDKNRYNQTAQTDQTRASLLETAEEDMTLVQGAWVYTFTSVQFDPDEEGERPNGAGTYKVEVRKLSDGIFRITATLGARQWVSEYLNSTFSDWVEQASIATSVQHYPYALTNQTKAGLIQQLPETLTELSNFVYFFDDVMFAAAEAPYGIANQHYCVELFKNNGRYACRVNSDAGLFLMTQLNSTGVWSPWYKMLVNRAEDASSIYLGTSAITETTDAEDVIYFGEVTTDDSYGEGNVALGKVTLDETQGEVKWATAVGFETTVDGCSVAIGEGTTALSAWGDTSDENSQYGGIAIGCEAFAQVQMSDSGVAVGGIAIGDSVTGNGGIVIGHDSTANQKQIMIGSYIDGSSYEAESMINIGFYGADTGISLTEDLEHDSYPNPIDAITLKTGDTQIQAIDSQANLLYADVDIHGSLDEDDEAVPAEVTIATESVLITEDLISKAEIHLNDEDFVPETNRTGEDCIHVVAGETKVDISDEVVIKGAVKVDTSSKVTVGNHSAQPSKDATVEIMGNTTQKGIFNQAKGTVNIGSVVNTDHSPQIDLNGDVIKVDKDSKLELIKGTATINTDGIEFKSANTSAEELSVKGDALKLKTLNLLVNGTKSTFANPWSHQNENDLELTLGTGTNAKTIHPFTDGIQGAIDFNKVGNLTSGQTLVWNELEKKFENKAMGAASTTFEPLGSGTGAIALSKSINNYPMACVCISAGSDTLPIYIPNMEYGNGVSGSLGGVTYRATVVGDSCNIEGGAGEATVYGVIFRSTELTEPVGTIKMFAGMSAPTGYLVCDGSTYSTATYGDLAVVMGATGDTFQVPNLVDKFAEGRGAGTITSYVEPGLPNIKGALTGNGRNLLWGGGQATGVFGYVGSGGKWVEASGNSGGGNPDFNASRSSSIYKDDVTTVQPAACKVLYIIKF